MSEKGGTIYTKMGDHLHNLVQAEHALTGNLYAAEAAVVDVQNKFVGRIDMITASGEIVEIKTVSLDELVTMQEPRHEHKLQLGYYLGAMGAKKGKILYVAREAPYKRKVFTVMANEALYQMGKNYVLNRRSVDSKANFEFSLTSALKDQKDATQMASSYFDALKGYKQTLARLNASKQRMSIKKSISMAQRGGQKDEHNYIPGMNEGGLSHLIRRNMTGFGSPHDGSGHKTPHRSKKRKFDTALRRSRVISEQELLKRQERAIRFNKPLTYKPFANKFPRLPFIGDQVYEIAKKGLVDGGLDKARVRLAFDMETGIRHDLQTAPIWEASIVEERSRPLTESEIRKFVDEDLAKIQKAEGRALSKSEIGYLSRRHQQELMKLESGGIKTRTFRALHLEDEAMAAVKQAKSTDWLVSKGIMAEKDAQVIDDIARRVGMGEGKGLEWLKQHAASYEQVIRGEAGSTTKTYDRISELIRTKKMGATYNIGEWIHSQKTLLTDFVGALNEARATTEAMQDVEHRLVGQNIQHFDIPRARGQVSTLFNKAEQEALNINYGMGHEVSKTDTLLQSETVRKAQREAGKINDSIAKIRKTNKAGDINPFVGAKGEDKVALETMAKQTGTLTETQAGKLSHFATPDAYVNMRYDDWMVANLTEENMTKSLLANATNIKEAKIGNVKQAQYNESRLFAGENINETMAKQLGRDVDAVGFFQEAEVTQIQPQHTTRPAGLSPSSVKPWYQKAEPYIEDFMTKIAGEGSYAEAKELTRQGGQLLNQGYEQLGSWTTRVEKGLGIDSGKFAMSAGRRGLIGLGAMAAGALAAYTLWDQPTFSNKPFRPPLRKVSTPSGKDDDYRDTRFDNEGLSHDMRMRMTDFGSGYKGSRGSTIAHIQSIDATPNLSHPYQFSTQEQKARNPRLPSLGGRSELGRLLNPRFKPPMVSEVNFHSNLMFPKNPKSVDMGKFKRISNFRKRASLGTAPLFQMHDNAINHHQM